ncbi:hypothetical protein JRQ81_006263 [Phrynocephalus forsythii]|uniref:Shelterin complex subunit TPP1/Est3 domain-containing protein n=1 Tax=Phrynocephalus forsythii TaxID=171643 RepID=A0A9Q0XEE2_9SAUR|nr:hypothetical protein JRQ81_006263 [Phrynocephalus forsythii]
MNRRPSRSCWREPKEVRGLQSESSNSEDSQAKGGRPSYLDPWIVNLLLEYEESETRKDGQIGHVLKVLDNASALNHDGQRPAAVLYIGDGHNYIETVFTAQAAQMPTCDVPQSEISGLVGRFIILQNYRVCFKEASKMEDCEFYILLDSFRTMPLHRKATKQHDCNQEPSVLQKIKELWQKRCALQSWLSSEPASISEVVKEIKEDRLSILKQNVKDCLSNPSDEVDFEQLNIYPETKWQAECKRDKVCLNSDIFMVPAKLLAINAESKEAFCKSCLPNISHVPDTGDSSQNEDCSTISFFSAESQEVDHSLENPWNILPELTLTTSSDSLGTPPGLPMTQQMLLASTAEKEASCPNSCTPDFLEPCAYVSHCNSEQVDSEVTASATMLPSHNVTSVKEPVRAQQIPITHHNMADTIESIPCGQPLENSHFPTSTSTLSSAHPSTGNDCSFGPMCENTEGSPAASLQRTQGRRTEDKTPETDRKGVAVKRKQMTTDDDKPSETCLISACTRQKTLEQPSAPEFPHSKQSGKLPTWKPPLTFVSTPKKSRMEEIHDQQASNQLRRSERLLRKGRDQGAAEGATRRLEQPPGSQQQQCVRGPSFKTTYKSPELCAQVRSTRLVPCPRAKSELDAGDVDACPELRLDC